MASKSNLVPIVPRIRGEIIAHSVVTFLVLVVVGFRLLGRVRGIGLGWDDGLVVLGTLMAIALLAMEGVWATLGEGHDLIPTEPYFPQLMANTPQILQMLVAFTLVYLQALGAIKCSLLTFYLRMFPSRKMQLIIKFSIVMTLVWLVAHDLALIFLCKPVQYQWDLTIPADQNPTCGDALSLYTSVVTTNIFSDFWIMGLPMYSIWHLKMRTGEKIALTVCFLLGLGRYKQKMTSSRLNEGTGDQFKDSEATAGSRNKSAGNKMGGSARSYGAATLVDDTWELNNYTPGGANNGKKQLYEDTAESLDDRGSEKRLTSPNFPPPSQIAVRTDWTVSRA
ncbi:uncharacterized protein BP5553_04797 [Venustampulla echinocandica]|uniref:Rhodopsin domain-containing protein n=1 Tax=Venustampulla echinocandica TaxID=2656787 RepID=A0A370TPC4_9HELO|nr:uncharacterized protein BP5553_04797 [Venustampulla echinocandica]RDL37364.1 hypothetical protein BP5553_04797 [Venustampulla echinocandica]